MKILDQDFQRLEPEQDKQIYRETDGAERITTPYSRIAINILYSNLFVFSVLLNDWDYFIAKSNCLNTTSNSKMLLLKAESHQTDWLMKQFKQETSFWAFTVASIGWMDLHVAEASRPAEIQHALLRRRPLVHARPCDDLLVRVIVHVHV